jgi:hypothetical protein
VNIKTKIRATAGFTKEDKQPDKAEHYFKK